MPRLAVLVALALTSATLPPPAMAEEAAAAPKPAARVTVTMTGPQGVKAQVSFKGPGGRTVFKAAKKKKATVVVPLRAGSFRVVAPDLVVRGRLYEPVVSRTTYKVKKVRKGRKAAKVRLKVVWKPVAKTGDIMATGATTRSIDLRWAGVGKTFEVRRASGEKAPATRRAGTRVHLGKKRSLTDEGLAEGGRYAYSLWSKKGKKWVGPTTMVAGTIKGALGAAYALAPGAVIVDPSDKDQVEMTAGGALVTLAPGRPAPPVGSGFVLPASRALPMGALGKVAEISPDGRRVLVTSGTVADAFDLYKVDVDFSAPLDLPDLAVGNAPVLPESGVPLGADGEDSSPELRQRSAGARPAKPERAPRITVGEHRSIPRAPTAAAPVPNSLSVDDARKKESCFSYATDVDLRMYDWWGTADGDFTMDFHRKKLWSGWGVEVNAPPHAMVASSWFEAKLGAKLDAVVKKQLSCTIGEDFPFNIPTHPAPVAVQFSGGLAVSVGGQVGVKAMDVSVTLRGEGGVSVGVGVDNGEHGDSKLSGDVSGGEGMARASGEFGIFGELVVGFGRISKRDAEFSAGAVAGFYGEVWAPKVKLEGEWGSDGAANCTTFTGQVEGSFGLTAQAWFMGLEGGGKLSLMDGVADPPLFEKNWPEGCATDAELGDGDVRATLRWGSRPDYDLHVTDPSGETVYYSNPASASGGELDHDWIPGCGNDQQTQSWVENVNWATGEAPRGTYGVQVVEYDSCGLVDQEWTLRVYVKGREVISQSGSGSSPVFEFTVQ